MLDYNSIASSIVSASYAMSDDESSAALSNLVHDIANEFAKVDATFDKAEFIKECGI